MLPIKTVIVEPVKIEPGVTVPIVNADEPLVKSDELWQCPVCMQWIKQNEKHICPLHFHPINQPVYQDVLERIATALESIAATLNI